LQVLQGFLSALVSIDPKTANAFLDEAVEHVVLGEWFPELQASVPIDAAGVRRLQQALVFDKAPVKNFYVLIYGGVCEPIPGPDFRDLVVAIGRKPDGNRIALEILSMRLHNDGTAKREPLPETVEAGRTLLDQYTFERRGGQADHDDYKLGVVSSKCLVGPAGAPIAKKLCREMKAAVESYDAYASEQDDLLKALFKRQPLAMLDELISGNDKDRRKSIELVHETMSNGRKPLSVLDDEVLLEWCEADPAIRFPFAAGIALLFDRENDTAQHEWCPVAAELLARSPDPVLIFDEIKSRLWPRSWSGSLASKLESRLHLLDRLTIGDNPDLVAAFQEFRAELVERIAKERERELREDRAESERFE
jgi:hypothetical protein